MLPMLFTNFKFATWNKLFEQNWAYWLLLIMLQKEKLYIIGNIIVNIFIYLSTNIFRITLNINIYELFFNYITYELIIFSHRVLK